MKKSILALSVLSVLSFGATAAIGETGTSPRDDYSSWDEFYTAVQHEDTTVVQKQALVQTWADSHGLQLWFEEEGDDTVVKVIRPDGTQTEVNLENPNRKDEGQIELLKQQVVAHAKNNYIGGVDPIEGVDPINPIPVTREEAVEYVQSHDVKNGEHFAKAVAYRMNSEDKYELNNEQKLAAVNKQFATVDGKPMFSGVASIDGEIDGVILINNQTGEQYTQAQVDEMAKDAKAQIVSEAEKRAVTPVNPIYPVDPINPIPVTREEAIEYVQSHDVKNGEHFAKAVAYRMNSEDKYELNNEQKLAAVNKQFATVDGKPMFSGVASIDGEIGGVVLINNQTGEQYTQAQVDEMAKDAKDQVVAEAAKRAEERAPVDLPPVNDPVKPPVIEPDNEKAAQAVKNLVQSGYATSAQMQAQAASINENAAKIDELFNVTADLREDLELQGARNMAAISARAFTTEEDQFSLGLGLGGSGSENAMAIGGAYQINAEWSVNSTVAFDTGSNVDYGVGVNYTW